MEKIVYDKKAKYNGYFNYKVPKCISSYVFLDGFRAEMIALYGIIADFYNTDLGYAYPTEDQISILYGYNVKTTRAHLNVLKKYGLLDIFNSNMGANKIYIPFLPLTEEQLFVEYPEAKEKYEKVAAALAKEKERSLRNLVAHKGYKYPMVTVNDDKGQR